MRTPTEINNMNKDLKDNSMGDNGVASSDMLDAMGLANLLRYIINPRQYVRRALIKDNPTDDDIEDYKAWAASRARHILEALSSNTEHRHADHEK